jgi:hypothetical protein
MAKHKIYSMSVASVYPLYIAKAEKKGRTKAEVDEIFRWLTGHNQKTLDAELAKKTRVQTHKIHHTIAATRHTEARKFLASLSYLVAMRLKSLRRQKAFSMRCRCL